MDRKARKSLIRYTEPMGPRHRPPRLSHIFQGLRPFYFVTFNTHNRKPILANADILEAFRGFAVRGRDRGIAVGRFVIMPDHVHLFVALPEADLRLEDWVRALRIALGKVLLKQGHPKPHWQEGFFDHLMRSAESYSEKWAYVRMNPVRAGLVADPEDWPYQGEVDEIRF